MRVLMTGGGTGGHVNPALAIAAELRRRQPDSEIAFVGTSEGIESRLVPKEGYRLYHIEIQGLRRSLSPANLKTLYLTVTGVRRAGKIIKQYRPDLVVGTGGYVCYPLLRAAASAGVPCAVHESNAVPGVAIKLLAPHVDKILTNFSSTEQYIKMKYRAKTVNCGNPYRPTTQEVGREEARRMLGIAGRFRSSILIYGGSRGAANINANAVKFAQTYLKKNKGVRITLASGTAGYAQTKDALSEAGLDNCDGIELLEYIYDMPLRMAAADLVICRAGAMTLSEIALNKKPSILVPYPYATDDHQYKNARLLHDAGAAIVVRDAELTPETIELNADKILRDAEYRKLMSERIGSYARPDANDVIYKELMKLINI